MVELRFRLEYYLEYLKELANLLSDYFESEEDAFQEFSLAVLEYSKEHNIDKKVIRQVCHKVARNKNKEDIKKESMHNLLMQDIYERDLLSEMIDKESAIELLGQVFKVSDKIVSNVILKRLSNDCLSFAKISKDENISRQVLFSKIKKLRYDLGLIS